MGGERSPFTRTRLLPPDTLHLPAPLPAPLPSSAENPRVRQFWALIPWTASKLAAHKEGLKKLAVPALVLHGRYDPLIPIQAGRALHELIPGARLVEYDGGHNLGNDDTVRGHIYAQILLHISLHN